MNSLTLFILIILPYSISEWNNCLVKNHWWTGMVLLLYTPTLFDYFDASSYIYTRSLCLSHTHPLSHTFIIGQLFPFQSQTAIGSLSSLLIFHVSLFPAESITSGILSHEQTGLSVFASKHFNFFGLFFFLPWLCSGWVGCVCFSFLCVCFWTVNVCWMVADRLNVQVSSTFKGVFVLFFLLWFWHCEVFDSSLKASTAVWETAVCVQSVCLISCLGLWAVTCRILFCTEKTVMHCLRRSLIGQASAVN